MNWLRKHRPSPGTALGFVALMVALGGAAIAAIPDSNGAIHGCFKNNGNLRVVESAADCRNGENALAWNQQGPPGPPGSLTTAFAEENPQVSIGCGESEPGFPGFCSRGSFTDLGGPTVRVTVPPSGLVAAVVRAEIQGSIRPPDPGDTFAAVLGGCLGLFVDSQPYRGQADAAAELDCRQGTSFNSVYVDWFTFEASPGPHTISVRYRGKCIIASHGCSVDQRALFKNRKLWVTPIG